jgi:phospholipid/cholesterol/gamma-HCH transport system substrate-binding protein
MSRLSKEFKLGFIFLLAIVSLVYGLKYLKGLNVFQTNKSYYAIYDDIDGLQVGSGVLLNGFNIGMVSDIKLIPSNLKLLVTLNINEFDSIPDNSVCKIINQDLMGTKGVSLIVGSSNSFSVIGDTLKSGVENSLQDEVNAQILPLKNKAEELIGSVDSLLTIVAAVLNKNTRANLSNSIKSLDQTFEILSKTMIKIDSVVYKNDSKISKIISNLESITSNLNEGNADIKSILYNLSSITDSLAKSNIISLMENVNKISYKINSGSGSLAKLMNDDNLYDNLEKSTSELASLIEDIKNNPKRYVNFSILGGNKKSYDKNKLK